MTLADARQQALALVLCLVDIGERWGLQIEIDLPLDQLRRPYCPPDADTEEDAC